VLHPLVPAIRDLSVDQSTIARWVLLAKNLYQGIAKLGRCLSHHSSENHRKPRQSQLVEDRQGRSASVEAQGRVDGGRDEAPGRECAYVFDARKRVRPK